MNTLPPVGTARGLCEPTVVHPPNLDRLGPGHWKVTRSGSYDTLHLTGWSEEWAIRIAKGFELDVTYRPPPMIWVRHPLGLPDGDSVSPEEFSTRFPRS
jgi:hypothetical protein